LRLACGFRRVEPLEFRVRDDDPLERPFVFAREDREAPPLDEREVLFVLVLDRAWAMLALLFGQIPLTAPPYPLSRLQTSQKRKLATTAPIETGSGRYRYAAD